MKQKQRALWKSATILEQYFGKIDLHRSITLILNTVPNHKSLEQLR